jgi:transglutaminase-like putative cysteine protease
MLIQITHLTSYVYQPDVDNAQHVAYLQPAQNDFQRLLSYALDISPKPDECDSRVDVYGNMRTFFSIHASHPSLSVTAHSLVTTLHQPSMRNTVLWETVQEQFRYHAKMAYHSAAEFVYASPCVPAHTDFQAYALPSFKPGAQLIECAHHLMRRIHTDFVYETNSTQVNTPTLQALTQRRGVCQDFAHIMVACWRAMGLPARYVSGYLLTQPPPGKARLIGCDASHAWASIFVPSSVQMPNQANGQWLDFDPTNNRLPDEDYITLATGRDFSDVSPLRGVILGGADHQLEVEVTVMPIASSSTQQ